jgi:hypothetical protein
MFRRGLLSLLLAVSSLASVSASTRVQGVQWKAPNTKLSFVSSIAKGTLSNKDTIYVTGNAGDVAGDTNCMIGFLDLKTEPAFQLSVTPDTGAQPETCHFIMESSSGVTVLGHSSPGGTLRDLEDADHLDLGNTELYGMVILGNWNQPARRRLVETNDTLTSDSNETLTSDSNETLTIDSNETLTIDLNETLTIDSNETLTTDSNLTDVPANETDLEGFEDGTFLNRGFNVGGGRILDGAKFVYPLAMVSDNSTVYTVSLQSDGMISSNMSMMPGTPNPTLSLMGGPFSVKVAALPVLSENSPQGNDTLAELIGAPEWDLVLTPEGDAPVSDVAGILALSDVIVLAGSTNGYGEGFGIDGSPGTDMDGFVTKLFKSSGDLYGTSQATSGSPNSYRIETDGEEFVHGICAAPGDDEFVYVTGTTTGELSGATGNFETGNPKTYAFLMKLQLSDMQPVWTVQISADAPSGVDSSPVIGISCAVSENGNRVYFAGNVEKGGFIPDESGLGRSAGGQDVFIAKVKAQDGIIDYVHQFGSPGDDALAPRGGLVLTEEGHIVVVGNTDGALYRARDAGELSVDVFVALISHNGTLPQQVPLPAPPTTAAPTASPTMASNTTLPEKNSTETTAPTSTPTKAPSPSTPTAPATLAPTSSPTSLSQSFSFTGVTIRLEGALALDAESTATFEEQTAQFYRRSYSTSTRRRLQINGISAFDTTVKVTGDSANTNGNTITYNQDITFTADGGNVDASVARGLLLAPFFSSQNKQDYILLLFGGFPSLAAVGEPKVPNADGFEDDEKEKDEESSGTEILGIDLFLIIYAAAGILLCGCCSVCLVCFFRRRKSNSYGKDDGYDMDNDIDQMEPMAPPEGPLGRNLPDRNKSFDVYSQPGGRVRGADNNGMSFVGGFTAGDELFEDEIGQDCTSVPFGSGGHASSFGSGRGGGFDQPSRPSSRSNLASEDDFDFAPAPTVDDMEGNGGGDFFSGPVTRKDSDDSSREGMEASGNVDPDFSSSGSDSDSGDGSGSESGSDSDSASSFGEDSDSSSEGDRFA